MRGHEFLRASDADRDAVIDRLREAACEGRLEADELEQRVDGALRARTYGELAELLTDLPGDSRLLWGRSGSRINPVARPALLGAGLLVAVALVLAFVALVALVVLAAAGWWIGLVLFWLVRRSSRWRLVSGAARRHALRTRHAHHARPTGLV